MHDRRPGAAAEVPRRVHRVRADLLRRRWLGIRALDRWPNDEDVCAGVWLRTAGGFVPQGLEVEGRTAWVSGFDGTAPVGSGLCAVERYDVRTGERLDRVTPVTGQVGRVGRPPVVREVGDPLRRPRRPVRATRVRARAEGMDLDGDALWVVSESGARRHQDEGGRPLVPQLLKIDARGVRTWDRPVCRV